MSSTVLEEEATHAWQRPDWRKASPSERRHAAVPRWSVDLALEVETALVALASRSGALDADDPGFARAFQSILEFFTERIDVGTTRPSRRAASGLLPDSERIAFAKSLRGKYASLRLASEEFASLREDDLEDTE